MLPLRSGGFDGWQKAESGERGEGGSARATPVFHIKLAEREWVMMPYFKCYNQMHTKWKYSGFFALIFVLLTPNMWVGCRYFFCCMYLNLVITVLHYILGG